MSSPAGTTPLTRPAFNVIPYAPEHREQIVQLLNVALEKKAAHERDLDYWIWKHESNPFGPSLLLLAESGGQIVGLRAFLRWRLVRDGKMYEAAKPVDSVTHPEHQRRGIFTTLTQAACETARREGVQLLFNTPNSNSRPGYLKMGWQDVARLPMLLRPSLRAGTLLRVLRRKTAAAAPGPEAFFRTTPEAAARAWEHSADLEALLREPSEPGRFHTARSLALLAWRYCQHPHIAYYMVRHVAGGRLRGMMFLRTNVRRGLRELMIDDVFAAAANYEATVRELVGQLRRQARADYWVAHAAPATRLAGALRRAGFYRWTKGGPQLVVRPLAGPQQPTVEGLSAWHLSLGDLEGL